MLEKQIISHLIRKMFWVYGHRIMTIFCVFKKKKSSHSKNDLDRHYIRKSQVGQTSWEVIQEVWSDLLKNLVKIGPGLRKPIVRDKQMWYRDKIYQCITSQPKAGPNTQRRST